MVQKNRAKAQLYKFFMFDIKYFYPSIQKELLNKGLKFAKGYKYISDKDREIFTMLLNHYFFDQKNTWMKKAEWFD